MLPQTIPLTDRALLGTYRRVPWPQPWVGLVCVLAYFLTGLGAAALEWPTSIASLATLAGLAYWLVAIRRIHLKLADLTAGSYPVRPEAAWFGHLVPGYNLYWVFAWPRALDRFLSPAASTPTSRGWFSGFWLLACAACFLFVDSGLGTLGLYWELSRRLRILRLALDEVPPRSPPARRLAIVGTVASLPFLMLLTYGALLEIGLVPPDAVVRGSDIAPRHVAILKDEGVLQEGERIVLAYFGGLFSVREEGCLLTSRRLVCYDDIEQGGAIESAIYSEITQIDWLSPRSWSDPASLLIFTTDGRVLTLDITANDDGGRRFLRQLEELTNTQHSNI
ncbi:MAG: hypothetical protein CME06_05565 [Gemmatimonadetes bacterium]|nr:hypothetical protein [Gemmatimonadota bacterium]